MYPCIQDTQRNTHSEHSVGSDCQSMASSSTDACRESEAKSRGSSEGVLQAADTTAPTLKSLTKEDTLTLGEGTQCAIGGGEGEEGSTQLVPSSTENQWVCSPRGQSPGGIGIGTPECIREASRSSSQNLMNGEGSVDMATNAILSLPRPDTGSQPSDLEDANDQKHLKPPKKNARPRSWPTLNGIVIAKPHRHP